MRAGKPLKKSAGSSVVKKRQWNKRFHAETHLPSRKCVSQAQQSTLDSQHWFCNKLRSNTRYSPGNYFQLRPTHYNPSAQIIYNITKTQRGSPEFKGLYWPFPNNSLTPGMWDSEIKPSWAILGPKPKRGSFLYY